MITKLTQHDIYTTPDGANLDITLHAPKGPILSFRENLVNALKHTANIIDKPINLRYSGGLDSQALVLAAKEAGIEFKTHHLTYHYNGKIVATDDYSQSVESAKKLGIEVEYVRMDLRKIGSPFAIEQPRHIYNEDTLVIGASGDGFHFNLNNYVGEPYGYNDAFVFPMDVLSQIRAWSKYGKDIYTRFYFDWAELWFSMLFHKSLEPFSAFIRDNPEKHKKYDLHQMKFLLFYAEYGDELIFYDKKHASCDLPEDITIRHDLHAKRFWGIGNMWFKEPELRSLMKGEISSIKKTMHIPHDLLYDINLPLSH